MGGSSGAKLVEAAAAPHIDQIVLVAASGSAVFCILRACLGRHCTIQAVLFRSMSLVLCCRIRDPCDKCGHTALNCMAQGFPSAAATLNRESPCKVYNQQESRQSVLCFRHALASHGSAVTKSRDEVTCVQATN
jgi:hypothetical protein